MMNNKMASSSVCVLSGCESQTSNWKSCAYTFFSRSRRLSFVLWLRSLFYLSISLKWVSVCVCVEWNVVVVYFIIHAEALHTYTYTHAQRITFRATKNYCSYVRRQHALHMKRKEKTIDNFFPRFLLFRFHFFAIRGKVLAMRFQQCHDKKKHVAEDSS